MGARTHDVKPNAPGPKKQFGQHFLRDAGVLDRILRWVKPAATDIFVEIGAGDGALSRRIAPMVDRLIAIELDFDRISQLENTLAPYDSATVVQGDILKLDLPKLVPADLRTGRKLRIIGNLPYNIASPIIEKLLHLPVPVEDIHVMVQLEVAERITAKPGSRDYGFLSVHCQHHARVRIGFKVSPACFVPRPKVSSATVSFRPIETLMDTPLEADFEELCKAAFGYRRKTLANSLSKHPILGRITPDLLQCARIDGSLRAEQLSVAEYERLAKIIHELRMTNDE
jgi:16S rRNA (adenine1518-N6/adenine1519-N6)-dimethyltransferase